MVIQFIYGYKYFNNIIELWTGDRAGNLLRMNETVGNHNQHQKEAGKSG